MTSTSSDQNEDCFFQRESDNLQTRYVQNPLELNMIINVHKQLPGNQLRNISRPQNLAPRTFVDQKNLFLLPQCLDQGPSEQSIESKTGTNRLKIANKERLSLEEFFKKKDFQQVYNCLDAFSADSKSFTGRFLTNQGKLRPVDTVTDYNPKIFKELQKETLKQAQLTKDSIDSDFQSGNLCRAFISECQKSSNQYYLMLQNDINTFGYNIWFFFRFRNIKKATYTFNIVNMIKKTQNYKKGMQISVFSMKNLQKFGVGWQKKGDNINFGQTNFPRAYHLTEKYYYLSFQYTFEHENDEVYFAMNQPYTYSRMLHCIKSLPYRVTDPQIRVQIKSIGHTLGDNIIPAVKIYKKECDSKQTILISARQHPCQTVGSFVCEGMMNFFIAQNPEAKVLLENYQIVFIPMMNPDGVIHGSSRCNLAGFDLNRQWSQFLIKQFTPETYRIKKFILSLHKKNQIKYCFDLHGHGKKLNSFFFSCKKGDRPESRLLQLLMNKIEKRFNIFDCTYGIDKDKQSTLRSQIYNMGISNCYTLQNSYFGYVTDTGKIMPYNEEDLYHIGASVVKGILVLDNTSQKIKQILNFTKQQLLQTSQLTIAKIVEKEKDEKGKKAILEDNASDSDPDGDIMDMNLRLQTCCKNNNKLRRKVTEQIKKEKSKKKKNSLKLSEQKQRKASQLSVQTYEDMTGSCPQYEIKKSQRSAQKALNFSQQKRNMNKLSLSNKRTTVYSKKIKQRKQTRETKVGLPAEKSTNQPVELKKQAKSFSQRVNRTQFKFQNKRLRTELRNDQKRRQASSSVIYEYPQQGKLYMYRKMSKRAQTQQTTKIKSQKQIPGVSFQEKETNNEAKFSQLKQQSLKALLTDTFSVLKIKPKLSIKRYVKVNSNQKNRKRNFLQSQVQRDNGNQTSVKKLQSCENIEKRSKTEEKNGKTRQSQEISERKLDGSQSLSYRKSQYRNTKRTSYDFKFKRFENFLHKGLENDKNFRPRNSVFYYFPVL